MRSAFFSLFVVTCWGLGADVAGRPAAARGDDRASKAEQSIPDVAALEAVRNTRGDLAAAELLWQMARKGRLTRLLLKQAAALLDHQDPFVSGVAEWGIAVQIGYENNGVRQAWPPADPPPWYTRWKVGQSRGSGPGLVAIANRHSGGSVSRPKQFGSHRSSLIGELLDDPLHREEVRLSSDEWSTLVTWVDANAPYYAGYIQKRSPEGTPLDPPRRVALELPAPFAPP